MSDSTQFDARRSFNWPTRRELAFAILLGVLAGLDLFRVWPWQKDIGVAALESRAVLFAHLANLCFGLLAGLRAKSMGPANLRAACLVFAWWLLFSPCFLLVILQGWALIVGPIVMLCFFAYCLGVAVVVASVSAGIKSVLHKLAAHRLERRER